MPEYKLRYFKAMGLAETIRFLLSYSDIEFKDIRIDHLSDEWSTMQSATSCGQLPTLEIDGKIYSQTLPICRYLAMQCNLTEDINLDTLQIDAIANALHDFRKQIASFFRETDEVLKAKRKEQVLNEVVPFYLERLEELVNKNDGYLHRGKLSYADLFFAAIVDSASFACGFDITRGKRNLKFLKAKVLSLPAIKAWIEKRPNEI